MTDKFADLPEVRRRGLETMEEVYGFEMSDGSGDFFRYTADHLFADIWNRPGLSTRDRRLLLIGMLAGKGYADVLGIQVPAAHANGELDDAKRIALTQEADKLIWEEGHPLPLYQVPGARAVRDTLANFGSFGVADTDYAKIGFTA